MIRQSLLVTLLAAACFLAGGALQSAEAQAPTVGMTLDASGPVECNAQGACTVQSSDAFSITLHADPAPTFDMSGFGAEVVFSGLVWFMRDCAAQLQIERSDGQDVGACAQAPGPAGQARIAAISEVAAPPLTPFEDVANGDAIFDLSLRCPEPGTYDVLLTAVSADEGTSAPFGAIYFRNDTAEFPVRTQGNQRLDLDGDGALDETNYALADRLTITCQGPGGVGRQSPVPVGTSTGPTPGGAQTPGTAGPTGATTADGTAAATPPGGEISPEDATATAIAAANAGGSDGDDDDDSIWLWVIVAAVVAAAAGGLGFLAWRRYQAGGGGPSDGGTPAGDAPAPPDAAT